MTGLLNDLQAKSALLQIQAGNRGRFDNVLTGARRQPLAPTQDAFFSISNAVKTESSIFSALNDGLGRARASVALASAGTDKIGSVLDRAEEIIGAVEKGAPGSAFSSSLSRLEEGAALAVQAAGRAGTNLLVEGETLNVTLGFKAGGNGFDFRQQTIEAVGLGATDGARGAAQTITETVTETVEVQITREDRINERIESLNERIIRFDERVERFETRIESLSERQVQLGERIERFEATQDRLTSRLEDVGARPTDANDQRLLSFARRANDFADTLRDRGSNGFADFVQRVADSTAERAGLTISLDRLDRLENRLERVGDRITQTEERIERIDVRKEQIGERIVQFRERQEQTVERIERFEERLTTLSEERRTQVVGTRTETVEREVTRTVESPLAGSFGDILADLSDRIRAGDTDGARAIVAEVRERIGNVDNQLGQISDSLNRRGGFFSALTERLDSSVQSLVKPLTDEDAARAAAAAISESNRVSRLFGDGDVRPGILELFQGTQEAEAPTTIEVSESPEVDKDDAA